MNVTPRIRRRHTLTLIPIAVLAGVFWFALATDFLVVVPQDRFPAETRLPDDPRALADLLMATRAKAQAAQEVGRFDESLEWQRRAQRIMRAMHGATNGDVRTPRR